MNCWLRVEEGEEGDGAGVVGRKKEQESLLLWSDVGKCPMRTWNRKSI